MPSYQYRDSHVKDKTVSPTVLSLTLESLYIGQNQQTSDVSQPWMSSGHIVIIIELTGINQCHPDCKFSKIRSSFGRKKSKFCKILSLEVYKSVSNILRMIPLHSKCVSYRRKIESCCKIVRAPRMRFKYSQDITTPLQMQCGCGRIVARIPPGVGVVRHS